MFEFSFKRNDKAEESVIRVNAEYVMTLARFVSRKEEHGAMQFIHVMPHPKGGALLCASNGHYLGAFHDRHGCCGEPQLIECRSEMIKFCKAGVSEQGGRFVAIDEQGYATVQDSLGAVIHIEAKPVIMEGAFFDWPELLRRVVAGANKNKKRIVSVLPQDLSPFYFANRAENRWLTFHNSGPDAPILVRHGAYPDFVGLVMPMKDVPADSCVYTVTPEWLTGVTMPVSKAADEVEEVVSPEKGIDPEKLVKAGTNAPKARQ